MPGTAPRPRPTPGAAVATAADDSESRRAREASRRARRPITVLVAVAGGLLATAGDRAPAAEPARTPNVVVILADDLGYADIGVHGCEDIPTPHIDAMAKGGIRCTSGYVSHPFCSPTRAGLLTGRYQQRFGHENNPAYLPDDPTVGLPVDQETIADVMKSAGYATGVVGKWHLGAEPRFHPDRRGFDESFGFLGGGHVYLPGLKGGEEYTVPLRRDGEAVAWEGGDYLTDVLSREAVAFIERHREGPFLLYLAYNAPHTPLQVTPEYLERVGSIADEKRRSYGAMVCAVDDGVGRVLEALREQGIEEDTLVVFLSDNGGPTAVTNCRNDPLRGAKGQVLEGGIRVPFLLRWPGTLEAGRTFDDPVSSLDLLPTAAALAGASIPEGVRLDGVDLLPFLEGEAEGVPHDTLFWRTGGGASFAVRRGDLKLVRLPDSPPQLFDLGEDIGEMHDLAGTHPDRLARLQEAYDDWDAQLIAPRWESPRAGRPRRPAGP